MSERKQTPDILAEILGGETPVELEVARPQPAKPPAAPAKPKATRPASTKHPGPQQPAKANPAWQHRLVSFQEYHGWRPRYIDGKEVKDWFSGPLLHEYIATLAEEGWQVAAACSGQAMFGHADRYQVFFKRPL
jgi:hypothetical protein